MSLIPLPAAVPLTARLRALRNRLRPASLEVSRPQGAVTLRGRTAVHVRCLGSGVLEVGRARFYVDDGCDDVVSVDVDRAELAVRFRGQLRVLPVVLIDAPAPPPTVRVRVPGVFVDVDIPSFSLPLPPRPDFPRNE